MKEFKQPLRNGRHVGHEHYFCPDKLPLILVVDDDKTMRILLRKMENEGYQVAEAKNGEECLAVSSTSSQILSRWMP